MSNKNNNIQIRLLFLITNPKLAEKAELALVQNQHNILYSIHGRGTATSEIMDTLGLGSIDKSIIVSLVSKAYVKPIFDELSSILKLGIVNSGIAFTVPVKGINNLMLRALENPNEVGSAYSDGKEQTDMSEIKYSMIAAIVNRGYSENVMEAAREAGAKGGTVISSRYIPDVEMCKSFGLSPEEEKEIVIIVANGDNKLDIMKKISENCGMHSEAKGSVLSLPIEDVIGLQSKAKSEE